MRNAGERGTSPQPLRLARKPVLFYIKRSAWLEILVMLALVATGILGIRAKGLPLCIKPSALALAAGIAGAIWLGLWTLIVRGGYTIVKGRAYSEQLTASLAKYYPDPGPIQVLLGGLTAACGEEIFFRGFIQQWLGLLIASLLFMVAHMGKKDIRIVSYWSVFQGLYLGLFYAYSKNLLVPMIAHGLFDMGGMLYFRRFMLRFQA